MNPSSAFAEPGEEIPRANTLNEAGNESAGGGRSSDYSIPNKQPLNYSPSHFDIPRRKALTLHPVFLQCRAFFKEPTSGNRTLEYLTYSMVQKRVS